MWSCLSGILPARAESPALRLAAAAPPAGATMSRNPLLVPVQGTEAAFPARGRPITLIVPYAPGGVTDTAARLMAAGLEREFGVAVTVLNRAGAASQIGLAELVRAQPNGYTLSYAVLPTVVTHYLEATRTPPYGRDNFQPVAMHHYVPQVLAVRADGPFATLRDLVEAARARPETISVSTSGQLAVPHSQVLMLEYATGVRFTSVHYTGGAPSVTALLAGHVQVLAGGTADALPHLRSGAFRVLGIAAAEPDRSMPDVPTMRSMGYDVMAASATGIVAPAGTPAAVVETLTTAARRVIDSAEHQAQLSNMGLTPYYMAPDTYIRFWIDTEQRMAPVLRAIKPG
jgi:tripartite-type tricarboxylate transporter receptor subunit TctC